MKKKLVMLGLSICLFATACSGKDAPMEELPGQNAEGSESVQGDKGKEPQEGTDKQEGGKEPKEEQPKAEGGGQDGNASGEDLAKAPEVTFADYSRNIEEDGVLMLAVTENCPVIKVEGREETARRMNLVFEQQRVINQDEIQQRAEAAKAFYRSLPEAETSSWGGYGYGMSYKMMFASTRILSIEAESYDWEGSTQPNKWTSAYCFDVTNGDLLGLADVFTDEEAARKIVSDHIIDTINEEPYKDALLDDYESYVDDVMTENTFYLDDKGLVVICNPFMVTSNAAGTIEVAVPYKELKDMMNPRYVLE